MENARELGAEPVWYDNEHIGVHALTESVIQQLDRIGEKALLMSSDAKEWNAPYKIMCIDRRENTAFDTIEKSWSAKASVARSHKTLLEIGPATSSKGLAIDYISRQLGLDLGDCAAAGDSFNDIPMLKAAGFAYTVDNATEEVKQIASYVGSSCDEGGLADIVEVITRINHSA
jgi:hydroxymethylpyrimidine pyrophosphatase-like HAD family hydrolase